MSEGALHRCARSILSLYIRWRGQGWRRAKGTIIMQEKVGKTGGPMGFSASEEEQMRKIVMLLAATAALLVLVAGAALAKQATHSALDGAMVKANQRVQCTGIPCVATGRSDLVLERIGNGKNDRILLRGGDDQVRANTYGRDRDVIKGSSGGDLIYVDDGDTRDRVYGGRGGDKCFVDAKSEVIRGCGKIIVQ